MNVSANLGYKQTELGLIPESWEYGTLEQFWNILDCKHVTAEFFDTGYPLASIREVQGRFVDLSSPKFTSAHYYSLLTEGGRKPLPGDLILSRNATVGEVAQVAEWHPPFAMGQDVCLLRSKSPACSTGYLQSLFQSSIIQNQINNAMVGSTFKRMNVEQIRGLIIPFPPDSEQTNIANSLQEMDVLISSLDQLIAKKRDIQQATMQQLLTGQRRLPGFSGEWKARELGEVIKEISDGGTPSTADPSNFGGKVQWVVIEDIQAEIKSTRSTLTEKGLQACASKLWPAGTLILSTGATIGEVGVLHVDAATKQGICGIIFNDAVATTLFMKFWFTQNKKLILSKAQGSSIKEVRAPTLVKLCVRLPEVDEQAAIATILSDMDTELVALEARRDKARQLKQGMMQELLTGRIRLLDKEPV